MPNSVHERVASTASAKMVVPRLSKQVGCHVRPLREPRGGALMPYASLVCRVGMRNLVWRDAKCGTRLQRKLIQRCAKLRGGRRRWAEVLGEAERQWPWRRPTH